MLRPAVPVHGMDDHHRPTLWSGLPAHPGQRDTGPLVAPIKGTAAVIPERSDRAVMEEHVCALRASQLCRPHDVGQLGREQTQDIALGHGP
jgi:hypothetical protein